MPSGPNIALYYDPDGYVEQLGPSKAGGGPVGLMGRQVAGKEFLDAYLAHGQWDTLTAVVRSRDRAESLRQACLAHPSSQARQRQLAVVEQSQFVQRCLTGNRAVNLLYTPCPPEAHHAWSRRAVAPAGFALCGVTHTLCSANGVNALYDLFTAPFEPYDALICTSKSVIDMVRAVTGSFADYFRDKFGGNPTLKPRLEVIPLGVNPEKFHPPTPAEKAAARARLGVAADEVMVLCVGRLSHHAKAHPFPLLHAAGEAARRTGNKVHLVFAGWASHPAVTEAFQSGGKQFAPAARVSFVDGQNAGVRAAVWPAADIFSLLPDNIQETFGLVVTEAMATGLPVVGTDWDGYRDLIAPGETGFAVPTRMVRGATAQTTTRLLYGGVNYDLFLANCCQTVTVDPAAAAEAMTKLVADPDLRTRMGTAGRQRVMDRFTWEHVIRAYENLWTEQQRELEKHRAAAPPPHPVRYPPPEESFAGYPTSWVSDTTTLCAADGAVGQLGVFLTHPLTNFVPDWRSADAARLREVLELAATPQPLAALAGVIERAGHDPSFARASVAWLLKYGLLNPA